MEYNSSLPIYLQVANLIKRDIVTGKRELGEKLPPYGNWRCLTPSIRIRSAVYTKSLRRKVSVLPDVAWELL